jgi:hypothetical protein
MALWIKLTRPNVEIGADFVMYQSVFVDMERVTGYATQAQGSVTIFVDGKAFVVQKQLDAESYDKILTYCQRSTGEKLG